MSYANSGTVREPSCANRRPPSGADTMDPSVPELRSWSEAGRISTPVNYAAFPPATNLQGDRREQNPSLRYAPKGGSAPRHADRLVRVCGQQDLRQAQLNPGHDICALYQDQKLPLAR